MNPVSFQTESFDFQRPYQEQFDAFQTNIFKFEDISSESEDQDFDLLKNPPSPQTASFNLGTDLTDITTDVPFLPEFIPFNSEGFPDVSQPYNGSSVRSALNEATLEKSNTSSSTNGHYGSEMNTIADYGGIRILIQPKEYQIVNYNIYPSPELEFSRSFSDPISIQAFLIYHGGNEQKILREGFTNGDVQVLKPGQMHVSFPTLHLNRMTPIKNALNHCGTMCLPSFSVLFKIGSFSIVSKSFKLVSACNQIPGGIDVRPRKSKEKTLAMGMEISSSFSQPSNSMITSGIPSVSNTGPVWKGQKGLFSSSKKRAVDENPYDEDLFLHVKVRGDQSHRGFVTLQQHSSLLAAREEIAKSDLYPKSFRFWFSKLETIVQMHQENSIKAVDAVENGSCLVLEPFDISLKYIHNEILSLWLTKEDTKEPLVRLENLISLLFRVYGFNADSVNGIEIIGAAISHFFANITKNRASVGLVSLEDFKLFLKFFGPVHDCLNRVFNVYRES